jgi:hypothetical protein
MVMRATSQQVEPRLRGKSRDCFRVGVFDDVLFAFLCHEASTGPSAIARGGHVGLDHVDLLTDLRFIVVELTVEAQGVPQRRVKTMVFVVLH